MSYIDHKHICTHEDIMKIETFTLINTHMSDIHINTCNLTRFTHRQLQTARGSGSSLPSGAGEEAELCQYKNERDDRGTRARTDDQ